MTRLTRIIAFALILVLAGCDAFIPRDVDPGPGGSIILDGDVPDAVREREPLPSCGVERATRQDGPWNLEARRCFLAAVRTATRAEFVSTRPTIEGDPFRMVFRVLGPERYEVLIDSTQDAWSARTWERATCRELAIDENSQPGPDFGVNDSCRIETIG